MCQSPECSKRALTTFYNLTKTAQDPEVGCIARWVEVRFTKKKLENFWEKSPKMIFHFYERLRLTFSKKANGDVVFSYTSFVMQCAQDLYGPFDMLGVPCSDDSPCRYGAECNPLTSLCEYSNDHVIACLTENIDSGVAQSLFNLWRIPERYSAERLSEEIQWRFMKNLCTGPGSLAFRYVYQKKKHVCAFGKKSEFFFSFFSELTFPRTHWEYSLDVPQCTDYCTENDIVVRCLSREPDFCDQNSVCDLGSDVWCYREFTLKTVREKNKKKTGLKKKHFRRFYFRCSLFFEINLI